MVEVFKTNIDCETVANEVMMDLKTAFPEYKINFDLDDCDKILRVEAENISVPGIISHLQELTVFCEALE